jgi:hypothetical protein
LTALTALRVQVASGVQLVRATSARHAREIEPINGELALDDVPGPKEGPAITSCLLEFTLTPAALGSLDLAEIALHCDLPGYGLSDLQVSQRITIEVSNDPALASAANPEVVRLFRRVQTTRMVESAEQDLLAGDVRTATRKLRGATRRLEEEGETGRAEDLARLADLIDCQEGEAEHNVKRVRGMTKRLSE